MSPSSSLSTAEAALNARLNAIVKALDNLNRCLVDYSKHAGDTEMLWQIFLGEMDWRRELGRLLYDM